MEHGRSAELVVVGVAGREGEPVQRRVRPLDIVIGDQGAISVCVVEIGEQDLIEQLTHPASKAVPNEPQKRGTFYVWQFGLPP